MKDFSEIEPTNPYRHLLFKRGYYAACSGALPAIHPSWPTWSCRNFNVTYDPDVPFSAGNNERAFLAVLGNFVSLNCEAVGHAELTDFLFEKLARSENEFFAELDACCGRFVLFFSTAGAVRVVNDACGMKMVYYVTDPYPAVASHAFMLKTCFEKSESTSCKNFLEQAQPQNYNMSFLPGHASAYDGIRILVPNTHFDLGSGKIARFFPRQELAPLTLNQAVEQASACFVDLLTKFNRVAPLAISLTAGLDSRLTTAAARTIRAEVSFFTYVREGAAVNFVDAVIARRLSSQHGLNHSEFFFNYELIGTGEGCEDYQAFKRIGRYCAEFEHFLPLAYTYTKTYQSERLHVRSNIGEICRARYSAPPFDTMASHAGPYLTKLADIYRQWTRAGEHPFILQEFDRYLKETCLPDQSHGYDLLSLYYWEHLMPVWHGALLLESDLSHETVCLYNCRTLLCKFLAAPFTDQVSKKGMLDVIRNLWPSLLDEPINPRVSELPAEAMRRFRKNESEEAAQLSVQAWQDGRCVIGRSRIVGAFFQGEIEYAFYLRSNGKRVATHWYTPAPEVRFKLDEVAETAGLEIVVFARAKENPERKMMQTGLVAAAPPPDNV